MPAYIYTPEDFENETQWEAFKKYIKRSLPGKVEFADDEDGRAIVKFPDNDYRSEKTLNSCVDLAKEENLLWIAQDLKDAREKRDFNIKAAAEFCGVPYKTWIKWENGERECPPYVVKLIKFYLENK